LSRKSSLSVINEFQSEVEAIRGAPEPIWVRGTLFVLLALVVSTVVIMFVTKMDRVVSSTAGKIVPVERLNVVQALDPSIIKTIDVKEGQEVEAGQLLATLDPTFVTADVEQLRLQIASLDALIRRDLAELDGSPLVFAGSEDPAVAKYETIQKDLYEQRVAQYAAQINSYDSKIKLTRATIAKLQQDESRYRERETIATRIEGMRTTLAEHGTGSQLNMLLSQDSRLELTRTVEYTRNSLVEAQHNLESIMADREAFKQQWSTALSQELVKARNDLDAARASLEKATKRKDLVRITAAEPSVVLTIAMVSSGSVLTQGAVLFTLMPVNTRLEAEGAIASSDVGFVRQGDRCTLKIDAFRYIEHGTAEGRVRWISEGAFTTDDNGQATPAYYKVRCSIDAAHFINVPKNFRLIPGMTLSADLNVGTRSVAMYLLEGMLRGFNEAMREP
jgi:hemolysin D